MFADLSLTFLIQTLGKITTMEEINKLIIQSKKEYSEKWEISSKNYLELGYYDWCFKQIKNYSSIIEIGAGIGITTKMLINKGKLVTAIENNEFNFTKLVSRNKSYPHSIIKKITNINVSQNNFILADIINDNNLIEKTLENINFDSIVCWFLATNSFIYELNNLEPIDYKEIIYCKLFEDTSKYLPKGGCINIIERSAIIHRKNDIDTFIKEYTYDYKLEEYGLKIEKIDQLLDNRILYIPGIEMSLTNYKKGDEFKDFGLFSILITKK